MPSLSLSARSPALPTGHRREHHRPGYSPLGLPRHGPRNEEPPFTDGRLDALASCFLKRLREREGGVVGTLSALKANNPQEDLVVHRSELDEVFRTENPRDTPVQRGLHHLGLQHAEFQTNRGRLPIMQLRSEPFEAGPHETHPSFDFEPEVSVFMYCCYEQ